MNHSRLDEFNRALIVVGAVVVCFGALLLVLLAWGASTESIARVRDLAGFLERHDHGEAKLILTLGVIVVLLLMVMVVVIELTPPETPRLPVRNMKSGEAMITTAQIAERINAEVNGVEGVTSCAATVAARGKNVDVLLDLHVDQAANLAETADEACRRAQALVETKLAIALAQRPRARLHYRELRLRSETPERSQSKREPSSGTGTGWERPDASRGQQQSKTTAAGVGEQRDDRTSSDAPEEAQA